MERTSLLIDWSVSRAKATQGYNVCRLTDTATQKRYRTCGGGYDMVGKVIGEWLSDRYQDKLETLAERFASFNGIRRNTVTGKITLDGGHGVEAMSRIAEAIGLTLSPVPNRRGHTVAFLAEAA